MENAAFYANQIRIANISCRAFTISLIIAICISASGIFATRFLVTTHWSAVAERVAGVSVPAITDGRVVLNAAFRVRPACFLARIATLQIDARLAFQTVLVLGAQWLASARIWIAHKILQARTRSSVILSMIQKCGWQIHTEIHIIFPAIPERYRMCSPRMVNRCKDHGNWNWCIFCRRCICRLIRIHGSIPRSDVL